MYLCRETQPRVGWSIPRPGGKQLGPDSCFPGLVIGSEESEGERQESISKIPFSGQPLSSVEYFCCPI